MLDSLKDMFSRLIGVNSPQQAKQKWTSALPEEIKFWDKWLRNSGEPWPDDFKFRCDPNAPLQGDIVRALAKQPGEVAEILDVGAGPLTFLGKQAPGLTIHITAVDPLADEYDRLLEQYHIQPLVRTQMGFAERLAEIFPADRFDMVTAQNCMDHSYDPLLAFRQMLVVIKPNGVIHLAHMTNEGQSQNYEGLHQWNFFEREGHFCISNQRETIDVSQELAGVATITNEMRREGKSIHTQIRKLK
jgi:SAM-dependent methyltransferase